MSVISGVSSGGSSGCNQKVYAYIRAYTYNTSLYNCAVTALISGETVSLGQFDENGIAYIPVNKSGTYTINTANSTKSIVATGTATIEKRGTVVDAEVSSSTTVEIVIKDENNTYAAAEYRVYSATNGKVYAMGKLSTLSSTIIGVDDSETKVKIDIHYGSFAKDGTELALTAGVKNTFSQSVYGLIAFSKLSDEAFVNAVAALDSGLLTNDDLPWAVGDTRTIGSHEWVIQNVGGKTLTNGKQCHYILGMLNCEDTTRQMNSTDTNANSWRGSAMRTYCNGTFRNNIPENVRGVFKQFKVITAKTYNGSSNETTDDYFALPAEKEVFGSACQYSNSTERKALEQFTWYATAANRVKKKGDSGDYQYWWERSPYSNNGNYFCNVSSDGSAHYNYASNSDGVSPFGCI